MIQPVHFLSELHSFCHTSASISLSFREQRKVLRLLELLNASTFSLVSFMFSLKELLSSQQLTVTAARGKLTQLGKENSNQHDCQKKRKQPKDIASLKGVPVKCLWHVGTSAIQRELHVADIFTVISFQQLSCATVIAWTLILA